MDRPTSNFGGGPSSGPPQVSSPVQTERMCVSLKHAKIVLLWFQVPRQMIHDISFTDFTQSVRYHIRVNSGAKSGKSSLIYRFSIGETYM